MPAETLFKQLKAHNILVRYFDKPRINEFLRVTIGTDGDMQTFVQTLKQIVGRL
jgi:histidinol-phosphate aminotransferase